MRISAKAVPLRRGCGRPKASPSALSIRDRRPPPARGHLSGVPDSARETPSQPQDHQSRYRLHAIPFSVAVAYPVRARRRAAIRRFQPSLRARRRGRERWSRHVRLIWKNVRLCTGLRLYESAAFDLIVEALASVRCPRSPSVSRRYCEDCDRLDGGLLQPRSKIRNRLLVASHDVLQTALGLAELSNRAPARTNGSRRSAHSSHSPGPPPHKQDRAEIRPRRATVTTGCGGSSPDSELSNASASYAAQSPLAGPEVSKAPSRRACPRRYRTNDSSMDCLPVTGASARARSAHRTADS